MSITVYTLIMLVFNSQLDDIENTNCIDSNQIIDTSLSVKPIEKKPNDTDSVAEISVPAAKKGLIFIPKVKPLQAITSGTGSLNIHVYPEEAEVFINTERLGVGNQFLSDIQTGFYSILVTYENRKKQEYTVVHRGETVSKELVLTRKLQFTLEPSFSNIWVKEKRCFGPALDLGLKYKKNYYGINYFWNFNSNDYTFGGSFQFNHEFSYKNILSICPGTFAGFWYSDLEKVRLVSRDEYLNEYYEYSCDEELFFCGVLAKVKLGYRRIFSTVTYSLLLGTGIGHALQYGIEIRI